MYSCIRLKGDDEEYVFLRRGKSVFVMLNVAGKTHLRFEIRQEMLVDLLQQVGLWMETPLGRCPQCARMDGDLVSAFCEAHKDEYSLSSMGKREGQREEQE